MEKRSVICIKGWWHENSNRFSFSCSGRGVGNPFAVVQREMYFPYYVQLRHFSKLVEAISTADRCSILWILVCKTSFWLTHDTYKHFV